MAAEAVITADLSLILFDVNLVPKNDKWEVLWIMWTRLNKEFVPPAVERLEALGAIDVVYKHTTISTTVERNTQRLETFLARSVPELRRSHKRTVEITIRDRKCALASSLSYHRREPPSSGY